MLNVLFNCFSTTIFQTESAGELNQELAHWLNCLARKPNDPLLMGPDLV